MYFGQTMDREGTEKVREEGNIVGRKGKGFTGRENIREGGRASSMKEGQGVGREGKELGRKTMSRMGV